MTDQELQKQALQALAKAIAKAEKFTSRKCRPSEISFRLRGATAGMVSVRGNHIKLRLNMHFLRTETEDMLTNTIPHEVCHLIQACNGIKMSHDAYWRYLMAACMGIDPKRCHSYDMDHLRPHTYACACKTHQLSTRMHNSTMAGRHRMCRRCGERITYVGVKKKELRI